MALGLHQDSQDTDNLQAESGSNPTTAPLIHHQQMRSKLNGQRNRFRFSAIELALKCARQEFTFHSSRDDPAGRLNFDRTGAPRSRFCDFL